MMGGEDRVATPVPLTHLEYRMNVERVWDVAMLAAEEAVRRVARREAHGAAGSGMPASGEWQGEWKGTQARTLASELREGEGVGSAGRGGVRRRLVGGEARAVS